MTFRAEIDIMPLKALLDPQGKAVGNSMANIGLSDISNVRIGKHITLEIKATSKEDASEQVEAACKQMLANPVMESFVFEIFNQA
ncbi:MAG: phosphoribosylformylglycinamidine synthase subunit PurS [Flavobacteriales bacterium]|jgi:phosphoribosylformylglycinamidine synthase|nr:phosphoribosylformylglycinamidine synthase subunit PurS [Flavobacteriales bacterium]MBT3572443.1 phosphoribosylformylglycinamidine synthase subunit PurS [Flavobacteriales bacterium]MBT3678123.1 phosphoribosylformylglycinamidine synthase subunit PurS [Flavobacteriales bacterium]MBT3740166.1 phosphoribosylformylglycinamidine synthase subunit PurS [Flavobacteriales bacterium]MBT4102059.1 phosphoribosylformylglycinamidine synthase subunit PurS [Flavobacteriales bacterium]